MEFSEEEATVELLDTQIAELVRYMLTSEHEIEKKIISSSDLSEIIMHSIRKTRMMLNLANEYDLDKVDTRLTQIRKFIYRAADSVAKTYPDIYVQKPHKHKEARNDQITLAGCVLILEEILLEVKDIFPSFKNSGNFGIWADYNRQINLLFRMFKYGHQTDIYYDNTSRAHYTARNAASIALTAAIGFLKAKIKQ
ncbi:hypothetical protein KC669_00805 [Candidatus Dojkabacteria bacterium]|uniref:Uncharacterized protein n=1 Tax=Candidatus Dojkabacteria bacterium TaxID=2099670 RepID=A0A955L9Z9_9BACT|nr:hypothetical protein [Candidatus Dojkabacteria bacterium]